MTAADAPTPRPAARHVPLAVLDLAPIAAGSTAGEALRNAIDLAQRAEVLGYRRYWLAEHHFAPGVSSAAPAILIGQIAAATSSIRVGSGAVQTGHQTALSIVEQFGTLDALFPGRIDLGLGRSGQRRKEALDELAGADRPPPEPSRGPYGVESSRTRREDVVVDGLLIPPAFSFASLFADPRLRFQHSLLSQRGAESPDYGDQVGDIMAMLAGEFGADRGDPVRPVPGAGADPQVWIFGSSGGQSAEVAGARGLPFAANYHVSPATTLEAVDAYRRAFRPSRRLREPYVAVSADIVVADDDATARHLASPFALWVRSIRTGQGAVEFPTPEDAARHRWTDEDRALVADRTATQFVGSPATVADRLEVLQRVTAADELVVTTITHAHADRIRSQELIPGEWADRARRAPGATSSTGTPVAASR